MQLLWNKIKMLRFHCKLILSHDSFTFYFKEEEVLNTFDYYRSITINLKIKMNKKIPIVLKQN